MDPNQPQMPPAAPPPPPPPAMSPAPAPRPSMDFSALTSRFGTAELLIVGGSALILAAEVLFGWLLYEAFAGHVALLLSVLMGGSIVAQRMGKMDMGGRHTTALILLGAAMAVIAADSVILYFRTSFHGGGLSLLGNLAFWIGEGLAAAGAFLLWRGDKR
ncbi:MAG: hypothetical protein ABIZ34_07775 [Candidatus Limnocylindrales bacterium]